MSLLDGLVSYWKLDEASGNALDAHGSNELTDTNTVGSATGKINNARDFEADNSEYFTRADNDDLSTGDIDFTFSCWIYAESLSEVGNPRIICKINSALTVLEYQLFYRAAFSGGDERLRFEVFNGTSSMGWVAATSAGKPALNTWYHVVCWHNAGTNEVVIRVNDSVQNESGTTGAPANTSAPFSIGSLDGLADQFWDGLIDEVGFWKRVLTSLERTQLYNGGAGLPYNAFGSALPPAVAVNFPSKTRGIRPAAFRPGLGR